MKLLNLKYIILREQNKHGLTEKRGVYEESEKLNRKFSIDWTHRQSFVLPVWHCVQINRTFYLTHGNFIHFGLVYYFSVWWLINNMIIFMFIVHSITTMCQELYWTFLTHRFKIFSSQTLTPAMATATSSRQKMVLHWVSLGNYVHSCRYKVRWRSEHRRESPWSVKIWTDGYGFHSFVLCVISCKMHLVRLLRTYHCRWTPVIHSSSELANALSFLWSPLFHIPVLHFCFMHSRVHFSSSEGSSSLEPY